MIWKWVWLPYPFWTDGWESMQVEIDPDFDAGGEGG